MPLTLEQIDAINDMAPVRVAVEGWGGEVQVRSLTLQEINECNTLAADGKRGGEIHLEKRNGWFLVKGVISPVISIDVAEKWLTERAAGPVASILGEIMHLSGMSERAREEAAKSPED